MPSVRAATAKVATSRRRADWIVSPTTCQAIPAATPYSPGVAGYDPAFHTSIAEWRGKSFVQRYRCMRGADLIMECDEVRIFAGRRAGDANGIRAVEIPASIRALCE